MEAVVPILIYWTTLIHFPWSLFSAVHEPGSGYPATVQTGERICIHILWSCLHFYKSFNIAHLYKRELEVLLSLLLTIITWLARVLCNLYLSQEKILGISFHGFTATINIKVFWNFSPSVINISFVCIGYFLWKYASSRQLLRRSCQRQIQFQHSLKLYHKLCKPTNKTLQSLYKF